MFDSIRGKFLTVQEGIKASFSFRGTNIVEPLNKAKHEKTPVNFDAGAELLNRYQSEWSDLHKLSEENAALAEKVDNSIGCIHKSVEKQYDTLTRLENGLSCLPLLIDKTEQLVQDLGKLQNLIIEVENSLMLLTDLKENQQLQEQYVESRFQLALHREKKLSELENVRVKLTEEHRGKLFRQEKIVENLQKEKQKTFSQAFDEDLARYKETGLIPHREHRVERGPSLEEVELDIDSAALNELLND